ncbi:MAG TPA: DUF4383 domain-containing protein [Pyrinomonadaceae bacterium]|nr:DUF4383 domain-containing protein [Pyrinomonadaceae bacterium]
MVKTIATLLGVVFLLVGMLGFAMPGLLGAHLTPAHNVVHLVSGAVSLYLGLKGSLSATRMFALAFGAVYLLLGIAGFLLGAQQTHDGHTNETLLSVVPGVLHFGTMDNIIHLVFGSLYLIGALTTKTGNTD